MSSGNTNSGCSVINYPLFNMFLQVYRRMISFISGLWLWFPAPPGKVTLRVVPKMDCQ